MCTRTVAGARFCSWPEDTHLIDQVKRHWNPFITTLTTAGLPVPPGTYGHTGSGHDHVTRLSGPTDVTFYGEIIRPIMESIESSRRCVFTDAAFDAQNVLTQWAVTTYQPGRFPEFTQRHESERQTKAWVERDLTHRSPEEQGRALAPYVDTYLHCGETLPPIPTPDDPAPGAGEVTR